MDDKEMEARQAHEKDAREKAEKMSARMEAYTTSAAECILDWLEGEGADKPREEKLKAVADRIEAACMVSIMTLTML